MFASASARYSFYDPTGRVDNPVQHVDPSGTAGQPPPGLISDHPQLGKLWDKAIQRVLEPKFNGGSVKENLKLFSEDIEKITDTVGRGSNRAKGTAINVARETYSKVRTEFGHLAEEAGNSVKGMQAHHAIDPVASNPGQSLNPHNISLTTGNAASKGSLHNKGHLALEKVADRLAKWKQGSAALATGAEGLTTGMKAEGTAVKLLKGAGVAKKALGPLGFAAGAYFLNEKVAHAANSTQPVAADTATKMEQGFNKAYTYAEIGVDAVALLPGRPGMIASAGIMQKEIGIAGIEATGGVHRIVEAGKGVEALSKRAGWSDVNAETAGAVAAGTTSMGEGAGIIGLVAMGPIGWGVLGVKVAIKR